MARRKAREAHRAKEIKYNPESAVSPRSESGAPPVVATPGERGGSRTVERARERQQEQLRQRRWWIGGVIAIIAILAVLVIVIITSPTSAPLPEDLGERYTDIDQGISDQGYPRLGDPRAPVRVAKYASFSCPACANFHDVVFPSLLERIRAGDIQFIYVPLGTIGGPGGLDAGKAAMCVQEQGAFWEYHDVLFGWLDLYGQNAFSLRRLREGVAQISLTRADVSVDAYNACKSSDRYASLLTRAEAEARAISGYTGTPAITVNGNLVTADTMEGYIEAINLRIDEALARIRGDATPDVTPEATSEITPEATLETTPEVTSEATLEITPEATLEITPEATPES
jgi:protein-disulfide isomerase